MGGREFSAKDRPFALPWTASVVCKGRVTSGTAGTLSCTDADWGNNTLFGCLVILESLNDYNSYNPQIRRIILNSSNKLTVDTDWGITPVEGQTFTIVSRGMDRATDPIVWAVTAAASAAATAVRGVGWWRSFLALLNVTGVSTGGAGRLDVYIQTLMPDAETWQDVAHFAQVSATGKQLLTYTGPAGGGGGTQAEGAAVTVDNYWVNEDAGLAASTVRLIALGHQMRIKYVIALNGDTGSFTFAVYVTPKP